MSTARRTSPRKTYAALALALVAGCLLAVWYARRMGAESEGQVHAVAPVSEREREHARDDDPIARDVSGDARVPVKPSSEPAGSSGPQLQPEPRSAGIDAIAVDESHVAVMANFVRPDHKPVNVDRGTIELRDARGETTSVRIEHAPNVRISNLAPGIYTVRMTADGFEHREQVFDLNRPKEARVEQRDGAAKRERTYDERIVLWPPRWIAVLVETTDGRPLSALATDFGAEPKNLFVEAFQVDARLEAPNTNAANDPGLARFLAAPGFNKWELPGHAIGSLQLLREPPMWVGLRVYGTALGWEQLAPGAREILFHLDARDLEARFASVTLRVVDASSRAPVSGATVTLRGDRSAYRRPDLTDVKSSESGRIAFERVVPGRYELSIVRGESTSLRMIDVALAEQLDLGDVALDESHGLDILVVDERGQPVAAWVELGMYTRWMPTRALYPAMLRYQSDSAGKLHIPRPAETSIVRATVQSGRRGGAARQEVTGARSADVTFDPSAQPTAPLKLVIASPVEVTIVANDSANARMQVLDGLDLVVAQAENPGQTEIDIELIPGRYRARLAYAAGGFSPDTSFEVQREPVTVQLP